MKLLPIAFLILVLLTTEVWADARPFWAGSCPTGLPLAINDAWCWDSVARGIKYFNGTAWVPATPNIMTFSVSALPILAGTNFMPANGWILGANIGITEGLFAQPIPRASIARNLFCVMTTAQGAAKSDTFTMRQNAISPVNGLTCTATNAKTCSDITHSITLAANDTIDFQDVTVGSAITARSGGCSFEIDF